MESELSKRSSRMDILEMQVKQEKKKLLDSQRGKRNVYVEKNKDGTRAFPFFNNKQDIEE